ncbi:MAG: UDP-4-amino-4,6-dideoxy-N-acetyl-beta-L-altrosamine transaminase [Pseudomonadota bacterium]
MISYGRQHIDEDDIEAVVRCLRSNALTQGPMVVKFEQTIAAYVGARYAVAVSSGTAALHIAALAAGAAPGNALLTSPITFVATSNAALYAGAKPLFADVDPETINISPAAIEQMLKEHPEIRVLSPVHFAGLPCDMQAIKTLADSADVAIVEDAAHALGSRYVDGSMVGNCKYSLMTVFSFHPVKSITTGEGGLITTNDEEAYRKLLRLRSHGINKGSDDYQLPGNAHTNGVFNPWYYEMQELGFHYRITDIQCALGISQMTKLDAFVSRRRALALRYDASFANSRLIRPAQTVGRDASAHHLYPVRIDFASANTTRAAFMGELRKRDVITQVHYIPVTMQPFYQRLGCVSAGYPQANAYYAEALSLPLYFDLTDEQQDSVIALFLKLLG